MLILFLTMIMVLGGGSPKPVDLSISPRQAFAPVSVQAKITIPPNPNNRSACLSWDSEDGEAGQHCFPVEGDQAARTTFYTFHVNAAGDYQVLVHLIRTTEIISSIPLTLSVQ